MRLRGGGGAHDDKYRAELQWNPSNVGTMRPSLCVWTIEASEAFCILLVGVAMCTRSVERYSDKV